MAPQRLRPRRSPMPKLRRLQRGGTPLPKLNGVVPPKADEVDDIDFDESDEEEETEAPALPDVSDAAADDRWPRRRPAGGRRRAA